MKTLNKKNITITISIITVLSILIIIWKYLDAKHKIKIKEENQKLENKNELAFNSFFEKPPNIKEQIINSEMPKQNPSQLKKYNINKITVAPYLIYPDL
ncbi:MULTISPECIES: hypothetical protein [16SrI (Aster yellows group)]|uniref:Uncharacterized protein n=2 Tax=16SrI (Aster yellows group) TaxID=3042590 RepID=A0A859IAP5_9MOLU|nr:hypothetical protein [Chrysanthemum yellows phytoplasma]QKX95718.1 MAG: hypothetical protein RP166_7830 [Rapeseed phyllody phytoplasma]